MAKGKGKKPKAKPKSDNTTVAARVEEILRIRLDGAQFHDIVQYVTEKGWDITERHVRNYIRKADNLLVERHDRNRKRAIAQHHARRESLYARSVNAADYRTALAVLADLAKIRGLYAPDKVEVAGAVQLNIVRKVVERGTTGRDAGDRTPPPAE